MTMKRRGTPQLIAVGMAWPRWYGYVMLGVPPPSTPLRGGAQGRAVDTRLAAEAKPSQVWRLPAQHHPTLGALRFSRPSRPVPLLIHNAGARRSSGPPVRRGLDPMVMKQRF